MSDEIQQTNDIISSTTQLSKEDILKILMDENPITENKVKYSQLILIIENKKLQKSLGIIKGEYYVNGTLDYKGSVLLPLNTISDQSIWDTIIEGESSFYGFTFDSREMKIPEKLINILNRSLEGASIQDFIPGCGRRTD